MERGFYGKMSLVLLVLLAGVLSITSSIQNIQGVEEHSHAILFPLNSKQLSHIYVYSVFNLIWVAVLLPSYLILMALRKPQFNPFVSFLVFVCLAVRICCYLWVTETSFGITYRYLAFFNPQLEQYSFWFLFFTFANGCSPV